MTGELADWVASPQSTDVPMFKQMMIDHWKHGQLV